MWIVLISAHHGETSDSSIKKNMQKIYSETGNRTRAFPVRAENPNH